ncbi:MAG: transporter substrate-binding domain-containing protein [Lachnospiraceae bacterium]|nr:transporter substrate-binding domain-containing protein [Lachnospiraceae bacterium]
MKKKIMATVMAAAVTVASLAGCGAGGSGKLTAKVIDVDLTSEEYAFAVNMDDPELLSKTNEYIASIMQDGTFDKICDKYFGEGTPTPVKSAAEDSSKDQLVVATNAAFEPFEYMEGESYLGIDMEIADGLAKYLGKELVISNMDFDAVLTNVQQGNCDIGMSGLTVTDERKEVVNFTNSYYEASQKLIIRSDNTEFDNAKDVAAIEAILNGKTNSTKVGVQNGTTGKLYCEGDEDWGFAGYKMSCMGYKNGSLAVQDLLNGNLDYVIIDAAPAKFITENINKIQ